MGNVTGAGLMGLVPCVLIRKWKCKVIGSLIGGHLVKRALVGTVGI